VFAAIQGLPNDYGNVRQRTFRQFHIPLESRILGVHCIHFHSSLVTCQPYYTRVLYYCQFLPGIIDARTVARDLEGNALVTATAAWQKGESPPARRPIRCVTGSRY